MAKKRKVTVDFDELVDYAGDTPETFTTIEIVEDEKPSTKGVSKSIPGPKKLTNIPERIIKKGEERWLRN